MSRPIQIGDFVNISLGNFSQYLQIINISNKIHIASITNPEEISAIEYIEDKLKISGTDLDYKITFLSPEDYENIIRLINLPGDILRTIGLELDLDSLTNMCQANKYLNSELCQNSLFWRRRYLQDFGEPESMILDWKEEYKIIFHSKIYTFGSNKFGQRGIGDIKPAPLISGPLKTEDGILIRAKTVSAGHDHTIAIDLDNDIFVWGGNQYGQLGLGDTINRLYPTKIPGIKAKDVAAGSFYTMIKDINDDVYTFGLNFIGQLGLRDFITYNVPMPVLLDVDKQIPLKAKMITTGRQHSIVIDHDNNVFVFGSNLTRQLGIGPDIQYINFPLQLFIEKDSRSSVFKAKAASAGENYSMLIDLNDDVYTFGSNVFGQLGLGHQKQSPYPTQVFLPSMRGKDIPLKAKTGYARETHSIIIDLEDNVYTFGGNGSGELGLGNKIEQLRPTQILGLKAKAVSAGELYSIIIDLDDKVFSFGSNGYRKLGLNADKHPILIPTQIPGLKARIVSAGRHHSVVIGNYSSK